MEESKLSYLNIRSEERGYKLPSNTEKVMECLKEVKEYHGKPRQWLEEQAERVAWRIIKDWLDAQISLIRVGQAEVEQIMLPYMWNGEKSLYELMKEKQFALPSSEWKAGEACQPSAL